MAKSCTNSGQFKSKTLLIYMWIDVNNELPKNNTKVIGYDIDSLTPEKELLYKDNKFLYCKYGVELDYTGCITKWKPKEIKFFFN